MILDKFGVPLCELCARPRFMVRSGRRGDCIEYRCETCQSALLLPLIGPGAPGAPGQAAAA